MLSVCPHDCPSCCSLVVTVDDGRLTSVTGNPDHPFTRGVICGKVREYAERADAVPSEGFGSLADKLRGALKRD